MWWGDTVVLTFNSFMPTRLPHTCTDHTEMRMFVANVTDIVHGGTKSMDAVKTSALATTGASADARRLEKNWMVFVHGNALHAITSVMPHVVIALESPSSACLSASTSAMCGARHHITPWQHSITRYMDTTAVHGGPNPVLLTESRPEPVYLGGFHVVGNATQPYRNYLYLFSAQPPFGVLGVSGELQLDSQGTGLTFMSGLAMLNRTHMLVTYGSGDVEARARVLDVGLTLSTMNSL